MRIQIALVLLVLLTSLCGAQQSVSVWNSSTGSTVQIYLNGKADPVGLRLSSKGRKPLEYRVSRVSENWFEYKAGSTTMRATFISADEIQLASGDGNGYRWTRRKGNAKYPIPNGEKYKRSYWRTEGSKKKYLLLLSPKACSVMTTTPVQGKQQYKAYRATWVDYPRQLKILGNNQSFRFLNPMLMKTGKQYWFQSHPDYE